MKNVKVLVFAGSTREDSYNKKLARLAKVEAIANGSQAAFVDLRDYPLPLYDYDLEHADGCPGNALKLKQLMIEHDGFLIASPEYNSSISAVLKNTIDWISRSAEGGSDLTPFAGKVAALVSAAPGQLGGLRGLVHLRSMLTNLGAIVIPNQLAVTKCMEAFNDQGGLADKCVATKFGEVVCDLLDACARFKINMQHYINSLDQDFDFPKQ